MNSSSRLARIERRTNEALDIESFELVDATGKPLPPFSAGSHIDVNVGDGLIRQYSLCNAPGETNRYVIAVLRDPKSRGGSTRMHEMQAGQTISISDPKNHFALNQDATHSILIAGGIGVTPLLAMAEQLASTNASFELHYCTRSLSRTAFAARMRESRFGEKIMFHHDDGPETQKLNLRSIIGIPHSGTHIYVCGPKGFMEMVLESAHSAKWPDHQVHREYFGAAPIATDGNRGFEIQIASTGAVISVAANQTAVSALSLAGFDIATSCEQGVCGTCMTRVLEGTPDHRDMYFTEEERAKCDQFMPCCSRSKTERLVVDL